MMRGRASHTVAAACCGRMQREQVSHSDNVGGEIELTIRDTVNRPIRFSTSVPDRLGRIYRALGRIRQDREADPAAQSPQCEVS